MSKIYSLQLAYHVCPLGSWKWNLEQLSKHLHIFDGYKVVGLATLRRVDMDEVEHEIKRYLGDDVIIKRVKNHAVYRESVTFPSIMRFLESKINRRYSAIWYGHTKGTTHTNRKHDKVTKLWAAACYYYTLSDEYRQLALKHLEEGCSIVGPFRRFKLQKNFPEQKYHYHFSGTFFWMRADKFFASNWQEAIPIHRYGIEALPGLLFPPEESACTYGDKASDLYKKITWDKLIDRQLLNLLLK